MPQEKIADRIRKLMKLSESTNEHEAAQAAARAAELMSEHDITEAMLKVANDTNEPEPNVPERIVEEGIEDGLTKQRVAWRDRILSALAGSLDLEGYFSGGNLKVFGRESHVQTWKYVGMYLVNEVDRLADQAWLENGKDLAAVGQVARQWKGAYRLGAADVIHKRLYEDLYARRAKEREYANGEVPKMLAPSSSHEIRSQHALVIVNKTLDVIKRNRAEVVEEFKKRSKDLKLRSTPNIGNSVRSRSGYYAGREAGESVSLRGGGKALKS